MKRISPSKSKQACDDGYVYPKDVVSALQANLNRCRKKVVMCADVQMSVKSATQLIKKLNRFPGMVLVDIAMAPTHFVHDGVEINNEWQNKFFATYVPRKFQ